MKLELTKNGEIRAFEAIATIENFQNNRNDVLTILEHIEENAFADEVKLNVLMGCRENSSVARGVINYLIGINMIDYKNKMLTNTARRFLKTKLFPSIERGKYRFWIIDDEVYGKKVIYLERSKASFVGKIEDIDETDAYIKKNYTSLAKNDDFDQFRIKHFGSNPNKMVQGELLNLNSAYELKWEIILESEVTSNLTIEGEIRLNSAKKKRIQTGKDISHDNSEELALFINKAIYENKSEGDSWISSERCLAVPFDKLSDVEKRRMKKDLLGCKVNHNGFQNLNIHGVPLMPLNSEDAYSWIVMFINDYLQSEYRTNDEVMSYFETKLNSKPFVGYKEYIRERFTSDQIIKQLQSTGNLNGYWNYVTPLDLHLDLQIQHNLYDNVKHISMGDRYSMEQFVDMIVQGIRPTSLLFTSVYLRDSIQNRKFELFIEAFKHKGADNIHLITKKENVIENSAVIKGTFEDVYRKKRWPHDRYFAFESNGNWYYYKLTAELDQYQYPNINEADITTEAEWRDISVLQLREESFPKELRAYISSNMSGVFMK